MQNHQDNQSNKTLQQIIKQQANDLEVCFTQGYSGRGMYGRKCIAISGSPSECMQVIKGCIVDLHNESKDPSNDDCDYDFEMAIELIFDYSTDSMGLGQVIYWSGLQDTGTVED